MYAVIDFKWHQYIVKEWDKIIVDNLKAEKNSDINIEKVLMIFDENWENVKIWNPYLEGTNIVAKVIEHKKGEKIHVIKFKNKNRYSRKLWFRPKLTVLQIEKIVF